MACLSLMKEASFKKEEETNDREETFGNYAIFCSERLGQRAVYSLGDMGLFLRFVLDTQSWMLSCESRKLNDVSNDKGVMWFLNRYICR